MVDLDTRLAHCFQAVFSDLAPDEVERASAASLAEWDSTATVTLVAVIEEEFGIPVGLEDLESFISYSLVREYVAEKVGNAS
jgi:acyl carrier protein